MTSVYLSGEWMPSQRWNLRLGGWVTQSKAAFESLTLDLPEEVVAIGDYDFSQVHTYSDLEYLEYEVSLRGEYGIGSSSSLYGRVAYYDLTDDEPWVYGDVGGSVLRTEVGLSSTF
jgi:hypothetical protein